MQLVDRVVARHHPFERRLIAFDERAHGRAHTVFCQATHGQQASLELLEFFLKVSDFLIQCHVCPQPNRPVM
jgi:hypothetical protein